VVTTIGTGRCSAFDGERVSRSCGWGAGEVVAGVGHWDSMIASVDDEKAGFYGVFVQSRANKASKQVSSQPEGKGGEQAERERDVSPSWRRNATVM